jgi:predicted RNA-binding protein Jag
LFEQQYVQHEETMKDPEMTLRLSHRENEYLKHYAEEHKVTVQELVKRYVKRLQPNKRRVIHRDVKQMSGIVPLGVEAKAIYHTHMLKKHR